jgi:Uma2 family endonuclease
VEKSIGTSDGRIGMIIHDELLLWADRHGIGKVVDQRAWWRLGPATARKPNAGLTLDVKQRAPSGNLPFANYAPNLAVEVWNRQNSSQEMSRKRDDYFAAGTHFVWEVNPRLKAIRVHSRIGAKTVFSGGEILSGSPILPGFRLCVADVFRDAW